MTSIIAQKDGIWQESSRKSVKNPKKWNFATIFFNFIPLCQVTSVSLYRLKDIK
jgi:hypothetical protein